jgi:hypothetical protein
LNIISLYGASWILFRSTAAMLLETYRFKNSSSKNKTSNQILNESIKLYGGRFKGLNISHFRENLFEEDGVKKVPYDSN